MLYYILAGIFFVLTVAGFLAGPVAGLVCAIVGVFVAAVALLGVSRRRMKDPYAYCKVRTSPPLRLGQIIPRPITLRGLLGVQIPVSSLEMAVAGAPDLVRHKFWAMPPLQHESSRDLDIAHVNCQMLGNRLVVLTYCWDGLGVDESLGTLKRPRVLRVSVTTP